MSETQYPGRARPDYRTTLTAITIAIVVAAALTSLLFARVNASVTETTKKPLPVAVIQFELADSYERTVSYLGLIQAARRTELGFELPGQLAQVHAREGMQVMEGDVLAALDDATLLSRQQATTAELKRVAAELELARIKEKRQQDLRDTGAVSREAYDETRLRAEALAAQVEVVQAQLSSIDIELEKSVLRAPYRGVIAQRHIDTGSIVSAGTPILSLVESDAREAHIGIAVSDAEKLVLGEAYSLLLRGATFDSTLVAVRPDVNPVTRAVKAVFELPTRSKALDGEPITLALSRPVEVRGGWLPIAALLEGDRGVWNVLRIETSEGQTRAIREAVEVVEVQGDRAYVRGTISSGDQIIANGIHRVAPGTAVRIATEA